MPIQFWQCCDKNKGIFPKAKCKKCGKSRPAVGFVEQDKPKELNKDTLEGGHVDVFMKKSIRFLRTGGVPNDHKNENNRKLSRLKEKPGQFFISTFNKEKE